MQAVTEIPPINPPEGFVAAPVLVVGLDGTLAKTDLLLESLVALLRERPSCIFSLPLWLLKGRAYFKQQVARRISLDFDVLPYRQELLDYLETQRAQGRTIVLATACDMQIARQVAEHLKLFDLVLASDGTTNLSGGSKRDRLVTEFGERGFDYAGNDGDDQVVWAAARRAIVVRPKLPGRSGSGGIAPVDRFFEEPRRSVMDHVKALRPQHWLKNLLVFVPFLAAHRMNDAALFVKVLLGFFAFGCIASSGYLVNDLFDLPADRHHPHKRSRAFAAGDLPLSYALTMIPILVGVGCLVGAMVSGLFIGVTLIYLALNLMYSFYAKRVVILDVILLAGLYTMRLMAGSVAVSLWPSHWLLAFSIFLFLSLALVKRYGELALMRRIEGDRAKARGYESSDGELLTAMGTASGYLAVLVLALYITSDTARVLYGRYELMWFLCPLLLYWISHIWLIAHRGQMPDDPVVFAVRDWTSRILILLMMAVSILAL
jgi:4-hydroxybenzoate polyprenyltransferase